MWFDLSRFVTILRPNKSAGVDEKPLAVDFESGGWGCNGTDWLGDEPFVFHIPVSNPARDLVINFSDMNAVKHPQCCFQLTLQRSLPDFATELRVAVAACASISVCDIVSTECDGVDLSDRYEVSNLKHADVIDVTVKVGVPPRVTMVPAGRGRKRASVDAEDVDVEDESDDAEQNSNAELVDEDGSSNS